MFGRVTPDRHGNAYERRSQPSGKDEAADKRLRFLLGLYCSGRMAATTLLKLAWLGHKAGRRGLDKFLTDPDSPNFAANANRFVYGDG